MRTLLLDSTFFPVNVVTWQKAMILLLTNRAEVVDEYRDQTVRSVCQSFQLPKILRLFSRHKGNKSVKFTRVNIYLRDNYRCQYCTKKFPFAELTFDHIFPRSRGGVTTWENVVTSCRKCNTKKGAKTPKEADMVLMQKPKKPSWSAELCLKIKNSDPIDWHNWLPSKEAS